MVDCITLTVPAKESALMVVRLTAAGVAARMEMDLETLTMSRPRSTRPAMR